MVIGMAIIAVSYILANISFFSVLSNEDIIGTPALALVGALVKTIDLV